MVKLNTHLGAKLYICTTAQDADLDQTAFAALAWTQVKGVGSVGEMGVSQNILTYDLWDTGAILKAKGMIDAGSPEIELARDSADAGQVIMRTAAADGHAYALKIERNDKLTSGGTNTIIYTRALIVGPKRPQGRNEDFDLEVFQAGCVQKEIVVNPS